METDGSYFVYHLDTKSSGVTQSLPNHVVSTRTFQTMGRTGHEYRELIPNFLSLDNSSTYFMELKGP